MLEELTNIASEPKEEHVFGVEEFAELKSKLLMEISEHVCNVGFDHEAHEWHE